MIIRLRFFLERVGWKRLAAVVLGVAALAAAGAVFALTRGGDEPSTATTTRSTTPFAPTFQLQAVKPKTTVTGCSMRIRFTWKPYYQAEQYAGSTAVIVVTGTDVAGGYRERFTAKGVSVDVGPVSIAGGYRTWSARVETLDGDPPANDTTVYAAPPPTAKCE